MMNKDLEQNKDIITYGDVINYDGDECYYIYVDDVKTFKIPDGINAEVFDWKEKCNYIPNGQKYIGEASYYFAECCEYEDAENDMEFFEKYNSNDAGKEIYIIKYNDKSGQDYKDEWIADISITKTSFRCGIAQDKRFMGICYYVDEISDYYCSEDGEPEDSDYRLIEQNRIALTKDEAKKMIKELIYKKRKKSDLEMEYVDNL